MFRVTCVVDINDDDTITEISNINREELEILKSVCERVKQFKPYTVEAHDIEWNHRANFPTGGGIRTDLGEKSPSELYGLTEDEVDFMNNITPWTEYGFHTIERISYAPTQTETYLI